MGRDDLGKYGPKYGAPAEARGMQHNIRRNNSSLSECSHALVTVVTTRDYHSSSVCNQRLQLEIMWNVFIHGAAHPLFWQLVTVVAVMAMNQSVPCMCKHVAWRGQPKHLQVQQQATKDDFYKFIADKPRRSLSSDDAEMPSGLPTIVRELPRFRPPMALLDGPAGDGLLTPGDVESLQELMPVQSGVLDAMFPGQFFSRSQVHTIASYEVERKRREIDRDICCRTDVWFGTAPTELLDVDGNGPWRLLQGEDMFQAYSRGDCHDQKPHERCPSTGQCQQKKRLHTLWVHNGDEAELKYFRISSHCAFEQISK